MDLDQMMKAAVRMAQHSSKSDDQLAVPKEHVLPFLRLVQDLHDTKGKTGQFRASYLLWSFVSKILPYTRLRNCSIDTSHALSPVIGVKGAERPLVVGEKGILKCFQVEERHLFRLFELMDLEDNGPLHSYNLWTYISGLSSEYLSETEGNWTIQSRGDLFYVVLKKESDEE